MHRAEQRRQQGTRSSAHGWADTLRWRPKAACATDSAPQYTSTRAATRACLTGYSGRGCNNHVVSPLIQCTYMVIACCVVPIHYVTRVVTSIGQKGGPAKRLEVKTRQGRGPVVHSSPPGTTLIYSAIVLASRLVRPRVGRAYGMHSAVWGSGRRSRIMAHALAYLLPMA